jgi:hypothetical protein
MAPNDWRSAMPTRKNAPRNNDAWATAREMVVLRDAFLAVARPTQETKWPGASPAIA